MLFLDCEFTDLTRSRLLSLALVANDTSELYLELTDPALHRRAGTFTRDTVLPQFGLVPRTVDSEAALGQALAEWLEEQGYVTGGGQPGVDVAYDYHTDFDLLERALRKAERWNLLSAQLRPTHVAYLLGEPDSDAAMEASWRESFAAQGIDRHHALADARALRAAFIAVHGE